jgi:hypothetical protein
MVKRVCLAVKGAESAVVRYVPESRGARFALYPTDSAARDAEVQSADWPVTLTLGGEGSLSAWFIHGFQLHLVDGVPQLWLAEPLAAAAAGIVVVNPVVAGGRVVGGKYSRQQARRVLQRATYRDAGARAAAVARAAAYAADPAPYALFRAHFDRAKLAARSLLLDEAEVAARIKGASARVLRVTFPAPPRAARFAERARTVAHAQRVALRAAEDAAAAAAGRVPPAVAAASAQALKRALPLKASADAWVRVTDAARRQEARDRKEAMFRAAEADLRALAAAAAHALAAAHAQDEPARHPRPAMHALAAQPLTSPASCAELRRGEEVDAAEGMGKRVPLWDVEEEDGSMPKPDPTAWDPAWRWMRGFRHENRVNRHVHAEKRRMVAALEAISSSLYRRNRSSYKLGPRPSNVWLFQFLGVFLRVDSSYDKVCYWFRRAWIALYACYSREWQAAHAAFLEENGELSRMGYGPPTTLQDDDSEGSSEDDSEDDSEEGSSEEGGEEGSEEGSEEDSEELWAPTLYVPERDGLDW